MKKKYDVFICFITAIERSWSVQWSEIKSKIFRSKSSSLEVRQTRSFTIFCMSLKIIRSFIDNYYHTPTPDTQNFVLVLISSYSIVQWCRVESRCRCSLALHNQSYMYDIWATFEHSRILLNKTINLVLSRLQNDSG